MQKKIKPLLALVVVTLTACSQPIRDNNLVLDLEWKQDIYNLLVTQVADVDNFKFMVRQEPDYVNGSPHQTACIELAEPLLPHKFFIANLSTYGMSEVHTCDGNYWYFDNLVSANKSRSFDLSSWQSLVGVDTSYSNKKGDERLQLGLTSLFPLNEFKLTSQGRETLHELIYSLRKEPVSSLVIYGVADSSGIYQENYTLAEKRAVSVRDFLVEEGLRGIPIAIRGTVENGLSTPEERETQRRFMIEVRFNKSEK
ncbi:OmpA family protein [Vibrio aestuarianus]|uniref:OmpA family protein n=1 Tax=Vibrio aestuarianus TaxID=28171 RepID=UPI00237C6E19|nr:OmpA family protein [Vibrio aestuarianus]MDE1265954.1 OmpA family protein [Vibrio aestuarianus]MDE1298107.1 OmpA family protein [Vibrio aestuarianus]MDE1336216.1 OmpA family protein [Vibrio aestuarianus]